MGRRLRCRYPRTDDVAVKLTETGIAGLVLIDLEPRSDERGSFARAFEHKTFSDAGLLDAIVDVNISTNPATRTLRGLHYQGQPSPDPKIVRCVAGGGVRRGGRPPASVFYPSAVGRISTGC